MTNQIDINHLCKQYLQIVYAEIEKPFSSRKKSQPISEAYGEILFESINKIFSYIPLTEQDVFVDLGSGLGKVVLQVFLQSNVKEACGIEILPELHQHALAIANRVQNDLPDFYANRELTFLLDDFFNLSWKRATVILISSPCFTITMYNQLSKIINALPSIHSVVALRPMPILERLRFKKTLRIEGSWDSALAYLYSI